MWKCKITHKNNHGSLYNNSINPRRRKNKTSTSKFQKTQILISIIYFNTKMIKVKKQNPPMHKSFENILNVLPLNNELHHSFSIINNMTYEKIDGAVS
jgi:accessory colonization factor AcfC